MSLREDIQSQAWQTEADENTLAAKAGLHPTVLGEYLSGARNLTKLEMNRLLLVFDFGMHWDNNTLTWMGQTYEMKEIKE